MNRSLQSRRDDSGVVALEFVLALPFLLMIVIGSVVLGSFLSVKTQTVGLARDGARAAALRLDDLPPGTAIVGAPCPNPTDATRSVTVQATKNVALRGIPFLPILLPPTIDETVTMRCGG